MCGIIAVVPRPSGRTPPAADLLARVEDALSNALEAEASDPTSRLEGLRRSCEQLEAVDAQLRGSVGLRWMLDDADRLEALDRRAGEFEAWVAKIEDRLDAEAAEALAETAEQTNEALVRLKDGLWRIRRDRIAGAWAVATLRTGPPRSHARGVRRDRDRPVGARPPGGPRTRLRRPPCAGQRTRPGARRPRGRHHAGPTRQRPAVRSRSVRMPGSCLSFVYKAANEVGELGDNVRMLRAAISGDALLHRPWRPMATACPGPHQVGQRRHDQRGQRPSPQSGGGRRGDPAVRRRGPQR